MTISEFLASKRWFVDAMHNLRPPGVHSDNFEAVCHFVLLVYAQDSPLAESGQYQMLSDRVSYAKKLMDIEFDYDPKDDTHQMVREMSEAFLTKYQHSFEYEQLVTAHIVFMDNSKELRKPITFITEEDKRLKASEVKGKLVELNKVLISDIREYTKKIYGEDEASGKAGNEKIRSGIEALKGIKK